jgi:3',5'-cyclic AMP phosphodiesterase CpdA
VRVIIAQISDVHIELGTGRPEHEHALDESARRAIEHINAMPAVPDLVIVTGDCTNNGTPVEYRRFRELFSALAMPYYVIPGNHDQREHMLEAFGMQGSTALDGFVQYSVEGGPVRLLALDTNVPASGGGELCATRLAWLEERLAEAPDQPTLLFMHHPPFRTGWQPFDRIGLANADAFAAIVARHPQIERIVAGHTHTHTTRRFAGTSAMIGSATAKNLLVDENQRDKAVAAIQPPLCLTHVWHADTGFTTHTSVIGAHTQVATLHDGVNWVG